MPRDGAKLRQPFKYEIGEIIQVSTGTITITGRSRDYKKGNKKRYLYHCNKCGYNCTPEYSVIETSLDKGIGCSICGGGNAVQKGINDISTTANWMMKYIANEEDGYKYSAGSKENINFKCPDCGNISNKIIANVHSQGFTCHQCSDGYSYPEKFMTSLLNQLGVEYIFQAGRKILKWADKYKYDFLIQSKKLIIEVDGEQHYRNNGKFPMSVSQQKSIDETKTKLAKENGYKLIRINCSKSNLEFVKKQILDSDLSQIYNLNDINWKMCNEYGIKNIIKDICLYFNNNPYATTTDIGKIFKIHGDTVRNYLIIGTNNGWCNYDPKIAKANSQNKRKKPVKAWYKDEFIGEFKCSKDLKEYAMKELNINLAQNQINQCCNGKIKTTKGFICKFI